MFNFERQFDKDNKDGKSKNFQGENINPMINKYGCYLYSLINGAGENPKKIDDYYKDFLSSGEINNECLILDPAGIMSKLTDEEWSFKKSSSFDDKADVAIARFNNGSYDHFVQMDGPTKEDVSFDSYGKSNTVATGDIKDWRLLYKV